MSHEHIERERTLRQQALAGDTTAWRALYDSAFADLWAYVTWRCAGLRHVAEDVVQETWLVAVRRLGDFDPARASFAAWLRGIAANLLRNAFRCRTPQPAGMDAAAIASSADEQQRLEEAEQIARALADLPERYEAVLRAKYLELLSVEAIASDWGETPKAVESLLTRARQAFRTAYEQLAGNDVLMKEPEP
jgi:RNA polymerase sigma-70 factor, ECF subfamily